MAARDFSRDSDPGAPLPFLSSPGHLPARNYPHLRLLVSAPALQDLRLAPDQHSPLGLPKDAYRDRRVPAQVSELPGARIGPKTQGVPLEPNLDRDGVRSTVGVQGANNPQAAVDPLPLPVLEAEWVQR